MAETVWAREILAQECGGTFEALWEGVIAATNKLRVVAAFDVGEVVLGRWPAAETLSQGIQVRKPAGPDQVLAGSGWRDWVRGFESVGWELAQLEVRHNRFETDEARRPQRSVFYCCAHLSQASHAQRAIIEGDLVVDWESAPAEGRLAVV